MIWTDGVNLLYFLLFWLLKAILKMAAKCQLLGGIFSSFIQATLGILCVATLWCFICYKLPFS